MRDRVALFVAGALLISVASLASILVSHSSSSRCDRMTALRGILVLAVVAILVAVAGVAMGDAPRSPDPAPSAADVAPARQRIAAGGPVVHVDNIVKPRADVVEGYAADLMPTDYAKRIPADEIQAIATFIKAASGGKGAGGGS
ncbi:MAG: hypothetical protein QOG11_697 [Solirubrobacteraceae bacterium]|nr:hypothetical protein [Solirubrobacteraceae bacterium]